MALKQNQLGFNTLLTKSEVKLISHIFAAKTPDLIEETEA